MLKKVFTAGVLFTSVCSYATQCSFLENLAPFQRDVAHLVYRAGAEYNLGLTSVAIAWEESKLGLYKLRFGKGIDQSVGLGHTLVYYNTKGMSTFQKSIWMQDMITSNEMSVNYLIRDLLYWKKKAKGNFMKAVGSYNGGNKPNYAYANRVKVTIGKLEKCKF